MMGEISLKIMELRKNNNMSQEQLAELLNVSRQAVSKWERGEALPDINNLAAIAKLFNVSIDSIVNGERYSQETVEDIGHEPPPIQKLTEEEKQMKNSAVWLLITAIALFIAAPVVFLVSEDIGSMSYAIFFGMIICGVGTIIYSSHLRKQVPDYTVKEKEDEEESGIVAKVSSITSSFAVIVFLLLGFIWGLWHPGWLVFLLTPLTVAIVKMFKKDETQ